MLILRSLSIVPCVQGLSIPSKQGSTVFGTKESDSAGHDVLRCACVLVEGLCAAQPSSTPNKCDQIQMPGTLQRVIEASRVAIAAIPYELAWGEVDSAEDLLAYREAGASGTSK